MATSTVTYTGTIFMTAMRKKFLLCALVLLSSAYGQSQYRPVRQQICTRMHKVYLNQSNYVQYAEYMAQIPDLNQFHLCYWISLDDPERPATPFNYALDRAANTNNITVEWTGRPQMSWRLVLNGEEVSNVPIRERTLLRRWNFLCHSWSSVLAEWSVYMNGNLLDTGINPRFSGVVVRGRGSGVSGQNQNTLFNGMDQGRGHQGWMTLFHWDSKAIQHPSSQGAQFSVANMFRDCRAQVRGDLINWITTPRKGYGGITETIAKEVCGEF